MAKRKRRGINGAPVDRFTAAHATFGAVAGAVNAPLPLVLLLAVGWEIAEQPLKRKYPGRFPNPSPDSAENASWDVFATMMGYAATNKS